MSKAKRTRKTPGKAPRTSRTGPPPEAFEGLGEWAADVARCVTSEELAGQIASYRRIAHNRRLSAANRRLAEMQADALDRVRPRTIGKAAE